MTQQEKARWVVDAVKLNGIVDRTAEGPLKPEDIVVLRSLVALAASLIEELQKKVVSVRRLLRLIFGFKSEKTAAVLDAAPAPAEEDGEGAAPRGRDRNRTGPKPKVKGHGRNGAGAYTGAKRVSVPHPTMRHGDRCPDCAKGRIYLDAREHLFVHLEASAPVCATIYALESLRCNFCGKAYTAEPPAEAGSEKYGPSVAAMIGLLKYGAGTPFNRVENLQGAFGVPLPASTQWDVVDSATDVLAPVRDELVRQAAQGEVVYNDDTTNKILGLARGAATPDDLPDDPKGRTGTFTTAVMSEVDGRKIALFFTGPKHAGENLEDVLRQRAAELGPPIQMSDAATRNKPGTFETLWANCLAHGRRKFVEIVEDYPPECRFVLETLRGVYRNDDLAREQKMSPQERLTFHQQESAPLMTKLHEWCQRQLDDHLIEPNSRLGQAVRYLLNHWEKLTLFLRVAGAPLDNNLTERALKKVILHRKNSMFYRSLRGAHVADVFMSLIHTAELARVQSYDYLLALLSHPREVASAPASWLPWNYKATIAAIAMPPPAG